MAASTKLMKSGWGRRTVLLYSGWNGVRVYHFYWGISTISARLLSGLMPTHCMPFCSYWAV